MRSSHTTVESRRKIELILVDLVDDAILVDTQYFEDLRLSMSLAVIYVEALGERGPHEEPLIAPKKMTRQET